MARLGRAYAAVSLRRPLSVVDTAIAFDTSTNSGYQTAQSSYSWSHTCSGNNRYLTVGISMLSVGGSSVSSITYNGVALSLIKAQASVSGAVRAELWGLVAPVSGSHTITVTLSASLDSIGGAISFANVAQTTSVEASNSATATNVGAADATVDVTTVADKDWVIDVVATDDTSITVGAGQTSRNNVTGTLGSGAMSTEGPKTPAGVVTMSWTSVAALATWSTVSVALIPVSASGSVGSAAGIGVALGIGISTAASVGSAAGTGTALGIGISTAASVASTTGSGVALGVSAVASASIGSASGSGSASAVSISSAASVGFSAGTGTGTGIGSEIALAVGSTSGTGEALGTGSSASEGQGIGSSTSSGVATGAGAALSVGISSVTSNGTATGLSSTVYASVGSASGFGVADATGTGGVDTTSGGEYELLFRRRRRRFT